MKVGSDDSLASVGPGAVPAEAERTVPSLGHVSPVASSVTGSGRVLRWSVQGGALPLGWEPVPREHSSVERIVAETHALWVWLRAGYSWRDEADTVREELARLLASAGWLDAVVGESQRIEALRLVATDVIDGDLAPYIASHGGEVHIEEAAWGEAGGEVSVQFAGACKGCELSEVTLHLRIEKALAERVPELAAVRDVTPRTKPRLFEGLFRRPKTSHS